MECVPHDPLTSLEVLGPESLILCHKIGIRTKICNTLFRCSGWQQSLRFMFLYPKQSPGPHKHRRVSTHKARNRPKNPKKSSNEPLSHASDPELEKEYRESWREFLNQFIPASADYRNGYFDREFPDGSFRLPLISIYTVSRL